MRADLLVLLVGLAYAAAQVSYAPSPGGRPGPPGAPRRRRIRVGRRPRPNPQPAPEPLPAAVPSPEAREQQQQQQQLQQFQQQDVQQAAPSFQQAEFQPQVFDQPVTVAPSFRPSARPAASIQADSRTGSRFRPQQLEYDDYDLKEVEGEEDYEDEPDRLSILLQESSFQCQPSDSGYFADDSVDCEVFHYCSEGIKHSWICPEGNAFHQINLICMPQGSDNICKRSSDFHFVNDYLYQQINNDSLRPQYADRYYPDATLNSDSLQSRPPPQAVYVDRDERPARRRVQRPRPQSDFGISGNGFGSDGFRQPQSGSVIRPQQQRQQESFSPSAFRQRQAALPQQPQQREFLPFASGDAAFQRRDDSRPLPPVRPPSDPYPQSALSPSINFRGAPRPAQERRDDIVLGGFQGNVDIEELASRAGQ